MNKKFFYKFDKKFDIIIWLISAFCFIGAIIDITFLTLALIDEMPFVPYIISLVLLIFLLAFSFVLRYCSFYLLKENFAVFSFALFRVKVDYRDITKLRFDKRTKQLIAYYFTYSKQGEQLVTFAYVNINLKYLDDFVKALKEKNNLIVYEVFGENNANE